MAKNKKANVADKPIKENATAEVVVDKAKSAYNALIGKIVTVNHANNTAEVVVDKANLQSKIQLFGDELEIVEVTSENLKKIEEIASKYPNNFEFYCAEQ